MAIGGTRDVRPEGVATGTIIIGWARLPQLLDLNTHEERREAIAGEYGRDSKTAGKQAREIERFINQMAMGDVVLVADVNPQHFYIAKVTGDAWFIEQYRSDDTAFRRPVIWLNHGQPLPRREAPSEVRAALKGRWGTCKEVDVPLEVIAGVLIEEDRTVIDLDGDMGQLVEYEEGIRRRREVTSFLRSGQLVKEAKRRSQGRCEICGLVASSLDREIGDRVLECHHLDPLAERADGKYITTLDRVAIVCANCHRLLHSKRPALGPGELKARLMG